MVEKPEYIAFINPVATLPADKQLDLMAKFEPSETFTVGKDGTHEDFLKMMRAPRVALVAYAGLLAEQTGSKDARIDSMTAIKVAIHKRGRYAVEATTQKRSDKHWKTMKAGGEDLCRRCAQGSKSIINGKRGTQSLADQLSNDDIRDMLVIKNAPKYKNWRSRKAAMKRKAITPLPGRGWFIEKLENVARARGLLE